VKSAFVYLGSNLQTKSEAAKMCPMNIQQIITGSPLLLLGLLGSFLFASPVAAQVNGLGPSDPTLFDTVVNVPTAPNIGDFESVVGDGGATVQLNLFDGGSIGRSFTANARSEVNIRGGSVGRNFDAFPLSEVNILGGTVGVDFSASSDSVVNIIGGSVGSGFDAFPNSVVNISGGSIGDFFNAFGSSEINISGGSWGFLVSNGDSEINLFGSVFFLDDVSLDDILTVDDAFTIDHSNGGVLSGLFADGSPFSFELNSELGGFRDRFHPATTLTVTQVSPVPEPGSLALLGLSGATLLARRRRLVSVSDRKRT